MRLDDLLGLIFLIVFVVVPVLRGLLRGGQETPLFEVELEAPPEAGPPMPAPEPRREPPEAAETPPQTLHEPPPARGPEPIAVTKAVARRRGRKARLRFDPGGILEGIVWHEILSEPRARRRWKPKR